MLPLRCPFESELLSEGDVKEWRLHNKTVRPSSDVVVLLELKSCNEPSAHPGRFFTQLINNLEKELNSQRVVKNRYALVVFGGQPPYNVPTIRTLNGQEFVAPKDADSLYGELLYGKMG